MILPCQDAASTPNPPTSTRSTDSSAPSTVPPPTSVASQSRESDNEDGQSQGSRSSVVGSLANSSSSLSSGRDIDQDNRSSSPSLSASPLGSLDSDSDGPDSPKQGEREREKGKEGGAGKSAGEERRTSREGRGEDSCGDGEKRDGEGRTEDGSSFKPPSTPRPSSPLTPSLRGSADSANDSSSSGGGGVGGGRKNYFSLDSKLVCKVEYGVPVAADAPHASAAANRMNAKGNVQCLNKAALSGGDYPHGNPNIPHPLPQPLPPPPALKPLEPGGVPNLPAEVKVEREKPEKADKPGDKAPINPPSLLPQTGPQPQPQPQPTPHPHHYGSTSWQGGTATGCQGSWGYARYPGNHHPHQPQHQPPVQQQQLPSVYNPPSSRHSSSHPSYLPHPHAHPHREYLPRYAGGGGDRERGAAGERERGVRGDCGGREINREFAAPLGNSGNNSGNNSSGGGGGGGGGNSTGTCGGMGGANGIAGREFGGLSVAQNRDFQGSGRDGPNMGPGGRDFGPAFRDRDRDRERDRDGGKEFPPSGQNQNQNQNQNRDFGPNGAGGPHAREKEGGRWGEFGGQTREVGGGGNNNNNNNPNNNSVSQGNPPCVPGGLPVAPMLNRDPPASPQTNPSHPPHAALPPQPHSHPSNPSGRDYPPTLDQAQIAADRGGDHFHRDYPPGKDPYPAGVPGSTGPNREYLSSPGLAPNLGREYSGPERGPHSHAHPPHPHYQTGPRDRERDRDRDSNLRESALYQSRGGPNQPPTLSPSSSSSSSSSSAHHGHPPNAPYPPPPPPLPPPQSSHGQPAPAGMGPNARPPHYQPSNQTPPTPLSPLPSPSTNPLGGFAQFPPGASGGSAQPPACAPSCRPFHGSLNSHQSFGGQYHPNGNAGGNMAAGNMPPNTSNSNSQTLSPQNASKGPPLLSNLGNNNNNNIINNSSIGGGGGNTSGPASGSAHSADGHADASTGQLPTTVIKEEPLEEREESVSPPLVLRSPSPEPKQVDVPIHASQSAR